MLAQDIKPKLTRFLTFGFLLIFVFSFVSPVFARTEDEIQAEIDQKQEELNQLETQLDSKQTQLKAATASKNNADSELENVNAEITSYEIEIEVLELEYEQINQTYLVKKLEKEKIEKKQEQQLGALYMDWKGSDEIVGVFSSQNVDPIKLTYYQEIVAETDQEGLNATYAKLSDLEGTLAELDTKKQEIESKRAELDTRKTELEKAIAQLRSQEASYAEGIKQLKPKVTQTQEELEMLSSEQKALQDVESRLLGDTKGGATKPLESGEYYFAGQGRDLYQGHGVGLSQFGAYGAARSGWSANQIISHYYKGVSIGQGSGSVNIIGGRQGIPLEEYVAGAGEVPNRACGTAAQAAERPDKYVVDNPNTVWDCWPEEAIKAQIIAYRTYGLRNKTLYDDARSQVYTGTTMKQWAADETKGQVIYYGGSLISAVYSSDNNNGWGTANNDTVWSNYSGDGTPYPYLRATYDEDFTYHYQWSNWTYRTNSYSTSQLNDMIAFSATSGQVSSSARSFMSGVRLSIGTLTNIEFVRDPSGRVKKVKLIGTNGSKYVAGWLYKSLWNIWVGTEKPSGEVDYIYSLTFNLLKK